ncbi:MAG: hypothetical protein ABW166_08320 [Sedimenticola sp.]
MVDRYQFDQAVMIEVVQPSLLKTTALLSVGVFVLTFVVFSGIWNSDADLGLALFVAGAFGYWYFNEKRETIFVKDLLHSRNFKCDSVVELARKEAWLTTVVSFLRQTMESAKHWDGTQAISIEPLPKDEARCRQRA